MNKIEIYPKRLIIITTVFLLIATVASSLLMYFTIEEYVYAIYSGLGLTIIINIIGFYSNRIKLEDNILTIRWDIGKSERINVNDIAMTHHFKTFNSNYSIKYKYNNHLNTYYFENSKFTNKDLAMLFTILTEIYHIEYRDMERNDTLLDKNISEVYCVVYPDSMFDDKISFSFEIISKYNVENINVIIVDEQGNVLVRYSEDNGDFSTDGMSKITFSDVTSGNTYYANIIGDVYEPETISYEKLLNSFPFYINKRKKDK